MIGNLGRSVPPPEVRRRAYLKLVYENGYHDGYYAGTPLREQAYLSDEEALPRYRIGFRIGVRERGRGA
jgi:hypothetical protein